MFLEIQVFLKVFSRSNEEVFKPSVLLNASKSLYFVLETSFKSFSFSGVFQLFDIMYQFWIITV